MQVQVVAGMILVYITVLPICGARLLGHPAAQKVLRAHGAWMVPVSWIAGVAMVVVPLFSDYTAASTAARTAAFLVLTAGPMLIGLVSFAARDARRREDGATRRPSAAEFASPGARIICGMMSVLSLGTLVFPIREGAWGDAVTLLIVGVAFGAAALSGRASILEQEV